MAYLLLHNSPFKIPLTLLILSILLAACGRSAVEPSTSLTNTGAATTTTQPEPTVLPEGMFANPVLRANFPDPFLLQEGATWFAYATNGANKNVQVATSTDLVNWEMSSDAMPSLADWVKPSGPDVWAPEVIKIGDHYNLYYTARDKASGRQCVGVATSSQPQGEYIDTRAEPLVCLKDEGGTIDPSPFRDGNKLYLFYKNDGNCCGMPTYLYVQEMAADGLSLLRQPIPLVRNDELWEGKVIEAPTMQKHGDQYYLFFSANDYGGSAYAVGYAQCQSVMGPCQDAPENPILKSRIDQHPFVVGPGHQTIITVDEQDWIVYHVWQGLPTGRSDSRFMWIDKLNWIEGKPVVQGATSDPQPKP